jgi:hypothetical protein
MKLLLEIRARPERRPSCCRAKRTRLPDTQRGANRLPVLPDEFTGGMSRVAKRCPGGTVALSRIVVASGKVTSRSGKVSFFTTATLSCGFTMIANSLMGDATSESAIDIVRLESDC